MSKHREKNCEKIEAQDFFLLLAGKKDSNMKYVENLAAKIYQTQQLAFMITSSYEPAMSKVRISSPFPTHPPQEGQKCQISSLLLQNL